MGNPDAKKILDAFSASRTAPFRDQCANDQQALKAYEWSLNAGQALLKPIGIVEVATRNAIDQALTRWWRTNEYEGAWTDAETTADGKALILAPFVHADEWRKRAKANKKHGAESISHNDIIAHTSLGTWRNMIDNPAALSPLAPEDPRQSQLVADRAKTGRSLRQPMERSGSPSVSCYSSDKEDAIGVIAARLHRSEADKDIIPAKSNMPLG